MTAELHEKEEQACPVLTLRGRLIEIRRPLVMGILNVTPDSFYAASRTPEPAEALRRAGAMIEEGADILDIGACSTRPGSESPSEEEEIRRLMPALRAIRERLPQALISVDTFRPGVARRAIEECGADIINDISGCSDAEMLDVVAEGKAAYILMHMRGVPADMDEKCAYDDVTADVIRELAFKLNEARMRGVCNVIIDPGFGFAKTTEQNFRLLARLDRFKILGCPILAGLSRKRMVREAGECDAADSLAATVALNAAALMKGASIIRVHDVREAVQTVKSIYRVTREA